MLVHAQRVIKIKERDKIRILEHTDYSFLTFQIIAILLFCNVYFENLCKYTIYRVTQYQTYPFRLTLLMLTKAKSSAISPIAQQA